MPVQWSDSYLIGDAEVDAQHRHFFELANAFMAAEGKAALTTCAMAIYKHTREHFGHEEALMRAVGFPDRHAHAAWHDRMINRLNAISLSIHADCVNKQDLVDLSEDWALNHIPVHDAQLSRYLVSRPPTVG
jgi:hemerythrin-like metal-binding protein